MPEYMDVLERVEASLKQANEANNLDESRVASAHLADATLRLEELRNLIEPPGFEFVGTLNAYGSDEFGHLRIEFTEISVKQDFDRKLEKLITTRRIKVSVYPDEPDIPT